MAEASVRKYEFTVVESQWLSKSLEFQRSGLIRQRAKEMEGTEIYALRCKEVAAIESLINKVRGGVL